MMDNRFVLQGIPHGYVIIIIFSSWNVLQECQSTESDTVTLACTDTGMQLKLNTIAPFQGRIYAQSNPHDCEVFGDKQKETKLVMNVRDDCGIEVEGDHMTNVVVIQNHPLIQQKDDRVIQLYCTLFQATNMTDITFTEIFQVSSVEPSVTEVVNSTAPIPSIRLRITDVNGTDISGTKVGESLYFRIEIKEDSVYGIRVNGMTARNGKGDLQISLIDSEGCATDESVFPTFDKIPGTNSLQSQFHVFKFADDPIVQFEVNIHFCLNECNPVVCTNETQHELETRKKRRAEDEEISILPDYPMVFNLYVFSDNDTDYFYKDDSYEVVSPELVCTTKLIFVLLILGAVFLQIGLLAACGVYVLLSGKHERPQYISATGNPTSTISRTMPPFSNDLYFSRREQKNLR